MKWFYLFLIIRLILADEVTTQANIDPIDLADSIKLIEIAVQFPEPLDIDWSAIKKFLKILKGMENYAWRETQSGYCINQKLNGILENSQNTLSTLLRKKNSVIDEERTELIPDVKIFANSTELLNRKRSSITLLAAGAAAALVIEPIVGKLAKCSPSLVCQDSEEKMRRIARHLDRATWTTSYTIYRATQMIQYTSWATKT